MPTGPEGGVKVKLVARGAVNVPVPMSPVVPVTITVYTPLAPGATVKDPDKVPPDIVQT